MLFTCNGCYSSESEYITAGEMLNCDKFVDKCTDSDTATDSQKCGEFLRNICSDEIIAEKVVLLDKIIH